MIKTLQNLTHTPQPMKRLFILMLFIPFACTNKLTGNVETVKFDYINWACDCARWIEPDTAAKYHGSGGDTLADHCIFIEPADSTLTLPDTLLYHNTEIAFTGQFYAHKGFPKGYHSIEQPDKAMVFRYTGYKVIHSGYSERE